MPAPLRRASRFCQATCQPIMSWWSTWPEEPLPSTDTSSDFSVRHAHVHTRPQAAAFLIGPKGHSIKEVRPAMLLQPLHLCPTKLEHAHTLSASSR